MGLYDEMINDIAGSRWQETEVSRIMERYREAGEITEDDIRSLRPGRDMNVLVAKYVLGHEVVSDDIFNDMERLIDAHGESVWAELRDYSGDTEVAKGMVDTLVGLGLTGALLWQDYGDGIYSPAEAICKKALISFLAKKTGTIWWGILAHIIGGLIVVA